MQPEGDTVMAMQCSRCGTVMDEIKTGHWRCLVCDQVIERLRQYRADVAQLRIKEQRLASLTEVAAARLSGAGGSRTGTSDPTGGRAMAAVELQHEIAELQVAITEVEAALVALDDTSRQVVQLHLIERRPARVVALELHIGRSQFYEWRSIAILKVAQIMGLIARSDENRTLSGHFPDTFRTTG